MRPARRNARTHSKKQTDKPVSIIRRFGFINPLIVEADGTIIAGHLRYQVAKLLRMTTVPVILITHLSDVEKRAFALAENRISLDAGTDRAILAEELSELAIELPKQAFDLSVTGYDAVEIDQILTDFDEPEAESQADDLPAAGPSVSRVGDLWLLDKHRLLCGDAVSAAVLQRLMGEQSAAMVITKPPHKLSVQTDARGHSSAKSKNLRTASGEMPSSPSVLNSAAIASCALTAAPSCNSLDWARGRHLLLSSL